MTNNYIIQWKISPTIWLQFWTWQFWIYPAQLCLSRRKMVTYHVPCATATYVQTNPHGKPAWSPKILKLWKTVAKILPDSRKQHGKMEVPSMRSSLGLDWRQANLGCSSDFSWPSFPTQWQLHFRLVSCVSKGWIRRNPLQISHAYDNYMTTATGKSTWYNYQKYHDSCWFSPSDAYMHTHYNIYIYMLYTYVCKKKQTHTDTHIYIIIYIYIHVHIYIVHGSCLLHDHPQLISVSLS